MINPQFMQRALQLARLGAGTVSPNPMVGCVVVYEGKIIGEGWHQKYGEAHAEVNAIYSVQDKSLLSKSEVYVTLEPCSHFGKTPPCADLLIKYGIKKVIICNLDLNPLVAGQGIKRMVEAGIDVEVGLLEEEGKRLNKRFFTYFEKKRPFIILKWAESSDGFIAQKGFKNLQISNELSRRFVHKMRAEEDAIMVGTNTVRYDNPNLNTRFWTGENAIRILIDKDLSLSKDLHIFNNSQKTICYNSQKSENVSINNNTFSELQTEYVFNPHTDNYDGIKFIIENLYQRKVQSIIIEGGSVLLQNFIDSGLWDEAFILKSDIVLQEGIKAPKIAGRRVFTENMGDNLLKNIFN